MNSATSPKKKGALPDEGFYTGREKELEKLSALIAENKLLIVEGLSGIGKSSLVLHYAYQTHEEYDAVVWHEVQTGESLESLLVSFAAQLNEQGQEKLLDACTDPKANWPKRLNKFSESLRQNKNLIVIDAFNNCLDVDTRILDDYTAIINNLLDQVYSSRVVLTTKVRPRISPAYIGKYATYELLGMDVVEATPLFHKLCNDIGHEVSEIQSALACRAAGGHPFAIKILIALLHRGHSLDTLLAKMRPMVIESYGEFLLDFLYNQFNRGTRKFLEAFSVYRRPVPLTGIEALPVDSLLIDKILPYFLIELEPRGKRYFMHNIVREFSYAKLANNENKLRKYHKAAAEYYRSVMGDPHKQRDFTTVQRVVEAQYHYRQADDHQGIIATAAYLADELKPLVQRLRKEGKLELALSLYEEILAVDSEDAETHFYYASLLEKQGQALDEIEHHYKEALRLSRHVIDWHLRYILFLGKIKKYDEAKKAFETAIAACGHRAELYVGISSVLRKGGKSMEATPILNRGINHVPSDKNLASVYFEFGEMLRHMGKVEEAATILNQGLKYVSPCNDLKTIYVEYSSILKELGRTEEAAAVLEQGLKEIPLNKALRITYSKILRELGRAEEAATILKKGLERLPPSKGGELYHEYSSVLQELGRFEEAAELFEQGLHNLSKNEWTFLMYARATFLCKEKRYTEAYKLLDELTQFSPSFVKPFVIRACINWLQGDFELARDQFEKGLQIAPATAIYQFYAAFLIKNQEKDKALELFSKVRGVAADPSVLAELENLKPEDLWERTTHQLVEVEDDEASSELTPASSSDQTDFDSETLGNLENQIKPNREENNASMPSLPPHLVQRKADLDGNIAKAQQLLKEYEEAFFVEDDPKRRMKYKLEIERLKPAVADLNRDYRELLEIIAQHVPEPKLDSIETKLNMMDSKLNILLGSQSEIADKLEKLRNEILLGIETTAQDSVRVILEALQEEQIELTRLVLNGIEQDHVTKDEMFALLKTTQQVFEEFEKRNIDLPNPALVQSAEKIKEIVESPKLDVKHKLKAVIPIIPLFLKYELEIGLGSGVNLEAAWTKLVSKIKRLGNKENK